jgi:hypothetical protein
MRDIVDCVPDEVPDLPWNYLLRRRLGEADNDLGRSVNLARRLSG